MNTTATPDTFDDLSLRKPGDDPFLPEEPPGPRITRIPRLSDYPCGLVLSDAVVLETWLALAGHSPR